MKYCEEDRIRTITLNESRGQYETKIVKGMEIYGMEEINSINLNPLYSCRQLPVSN